MGPHIWGPLAILVLEAAMSNKAPEAVRKALGRAAQRAQRVAEGDAGLQSEAPEIPAKKIDDKVAEAREKSRPADMTIEDVHIAHT